MYLLYATAFITCVLIITVWNIEELKKKLQNQKTKIKTKNIIEKTLMNWKIKFFETKTKTNYIYNWMMMRIRYILWLIFIVIYLCFISSVPFSFHVGRLEICMLGTIFGKAFHVVMHSNHKVEIVNLLKKTGFIRNLEYRILSYVILQNGTIQLCI